MTERLVIDASVALKWVVEEQGSDEAASLLAGLAAGSLSLAAPDHLIGEVGNGLRKRVAQHVLSGSDAVAAMASIADLGLELVSDPDRWFRCLAVALDWQLTTYDALYVLLARDLDAELITADIRVAAAAERHSLPISLLQPR